MKTLLAVFFFALTLLAFAAGQSCPQGVWQCTPSVSQNYNYASCISGECVCRSDLGFDGNATISSLCRCDPPKKVYWENNNPYCLSYSQAVGEAADLHRQEILQAKVLRIYENLIYPTPVLIMSGAVSVTDIFAPNAKGRVDPLGKFETHATLKEYFYGLGVTPTTTVLSINVKDIFGVGNKVHFRGDVLFREVTLAGVRDYNLTQTGRYTFDENDLVVSAELAILNIGRATDPPPEGRDSVITSTCSVLVSVPGTCVDHQLDPEGYFDSFEECVNFMSGLEFGTFDRAASNTVACRALHTILTIYDPQVHCPHAGKTGGGKCVDVPYENYYLYDF